MKKQLFYWRRALCLILACLSVFDAARALESNVQNPYQDVKLVCGDVPESGELHDAVMEIAKVSDWADGAEFLPDKNVTRNEYYTLAYRKFRGMFADAKTPPEAENAQKELENALDFFRKKGFFGPDGTYGNGEKLMERAETVQFLFWAYQKLWREKNNVSFSAVYEVKGFTDVRKTDAFAQAVMWAASEHQTVSPGYYNGAIRMDAGFPDKTFRPTGKKGRCTRSEIALYFFRFSSLSFAP